MSFFRFARADKYAHEDLGKVVDVPFADEPTVKGAHFREGTVFVLPFDFLHLVGVHPAVSAEDALFFSLFQVNGVRHVFCSDVF